MSTLARTQSQNKPVVSYDINLPYTELDGTKASTKFPNYLPTWDPVWYDPLPLFHFEDPALRVKDKSKPHLLTEGATIQHIQPRIGSIVTGLQLNKLSDAGKNELALLVCERGVLAFPKQDLIDAGPAIQHDFMKYFGKLNYQPVSGTVRGYPGFHIIHREGNSEEIAKFFETKATSTLWHQDVSYEAQPPGYVMLGLLQGPEVGGDTIFAATDEAYCRLSPTFSALLDGLQTEQTSEKMINHARKTGGLVRKDPIYTIHPLVRVHPVTGKKCLFLNDEFVTAIHGMRYPESKAILDYLMQYIVMGHDFQARVKWAPGTIVMFDNRSTIHSAVVDYIDEEHNAESRHMFRLCAMAEVPESVQR